MNDNNVIYQRLWIESWRTSQVTPLGAGLVIAAVGGLGYFYGYVRAAVAVIMFAGILAVGSRFVRQMVISPPEPEIKDVSHQGLTYLCEGCGLEVKVTKASKDRPPSHCMEPMKLNPEGGSPPLRPV